MEFFTCECLLHPCRNTVTHHTQLKYDNLEKRLHRNFSTKSGYIAKSVCTVKVNSKFNVFIDIFLCCYDIPFTSSCLYHASMTIKTFYYPTDAQTYNS